MTAALTVLGTLTASMIAGGATGAGAFLLRQTIRRRRAVRHLCRLVAADAEMWCRMAVQWRATHPGMPDEWTTAMFLREVDRHPATRARREMGR